MLPNDHGTSSTPGTATEGGVRHTTDAQGNDVAVHYDAAGNVSLVEVDTDGDGRYDTAAVSTADGTTLVGHDDDGRIDTIAHVDRDGDLTRVDTVENGQIVASTLDQDGNGAPDTVIEDTDRDGVADRISYDRDGDGRIDYIAADTDGDGQLDTYVADNDGDGQADSYSGGGDSYGSDSYGSDPYGQDQVPHSEDGSGYGADDTVL
ncbi:hypothetical protein ACIGKQ_24515 [Gordonia sp. NPDC062954]|uniref:hypothetical protein n=1 Tax=Gordonia sp. NPDC062954 TaxID=3364003 RepID=UPI0037C8257E